MGSALMVRITNAYVTWVLRDRTAAQIADVTAIPIARVRDRENVTTARTTHLGSFASIALKGLLAMPPIQIPAAKHAFAMGMKMKKQAFATQLRADAIVKITLRVQIVKNAKVAFLAMPKMVGGAFISAQPKGSLKVLGNCFCRIV